MSFSGRECGTHVPCAGDDGAADGGSTSLLRNEQRDGGPQETLFEDGSKVKHFAVVTNIREWKAGRLIQWHREKAGTVEGVHDVVTNELAGGVMPCKYFGANAAWLRLAVIAHNVMTALKRLALPAELLTARPKRLRFLIFNTPGRLVHHARRTVLRLATSAQRILEWLEAARLLPVAVD
jgi:hypothetical protein